MRTLRSDVVNSVYKVFGGAARLRVPTNADFGLLKADLDFYSAIGNPQSGRPLEPDTVSTVEGRNSHPLTVPSLLGGTVFFW